MSGDRTIWSIGGGKGGVGKSVTSANLGCGLAQRGFSVILVDADLGGANLHTYFGIKFPSKSLEDFIKGRADSLEDVALPTQQKGLRLISGGGEFLGIANPQYQQKQKLISHIKKLNARFVIVDLGAGSTYNTLDFFGISNEGIVVLVPEPAAIQNAYLFLKSFVYRKLQRLFADSDSISRLIVEATDAHGGERTRTFSDLIERIAGQDRGLAEKAIFEFKSFRPKLLLNMASSKDDERVVDSFKAAAATFLGLDADFVGTIYTSAHVKSASRRMRPFMLDEGAVDARRQVEAVLSRLLGDGLREKKEAAEKVLREAPGRDVFGFNDNISHGGTVFHVQTEAQGGVCPVVETVIYQGGRIFFSKRSLAGDILKDNGAGGDLRGFATRQHRTAIMAIKTDRISTKG